MSSTGISQDELNRLVNEAVDRKLAASSNRIRQLEERINVCQVALCGGVLGAMAGAAGAVYVTCGCGKIAMITLSAALGALAGFVVGALVVVGVCKLCHHALSVNSEQLQDMVRKVQ